MPNNTPSPPVSPEARERNHEAQTPRLRNVFIIAGSVVVMLGSSLFLAHLLIQLLSENRAMQRMQPLGLIAAPDVRPLARFPSPRLELDDGRADWVALQAGQKEIVNAYGWVDRSNGLARIPVERAMDLFLARGFPVQTNANSPGPSTLQLMQRRPEQK